MLPGLPALAWGRAAAAPPLLGGPLGDESPGVVLRASDGEWVRAGEARTADAVAAALAAVLVACGAVAARRRRAREAFALGVALVVALIAVEVGPPWWARAAWPPLCAATAALAAVLVAVAADRRAPVAALATTLLFLIPALTATGQPAGPATVALVSTDRGEEVVAPRSLLDRLDALARPSAPAPVVTGATYDVRADDAGARVAARFVVHSFRPGENVLTLPLSDVRLERATVDGGGAYPSVTAGGYAVAVGGPGRHEVELRFAATVAAAGPERDLRFGIPEVPDTRLTATLPGEARQPSAVGRVGGQATTPGGERTAVAADLGAVRAVHLRWREGAGGAASVTVREACVWDVAEQGADLTAAYLVRVEKGAVAGLRYEVPAELDVLRVLVRTLDAPAGAVPLRDWSLAPDKGAQRLRIDFQAPASGRLLAVLECAPRKPLNRQPVLRFPRALFGTGAGEADAVYGLRASRVQVDGVGLGGVIDFPADVLKDFADVPDLRLGGPGAVRAFRPVTGASPELRPVLRVGDEPAVRTSTLWHAGPGRADGSGVVTWQAKEFQPLVEFALPGVKVLEVRGADVAGWNQSGGRVQVWLRPGGRDGSFEWLGSATPADGAFEPAHPAVARGRHQADEVRVRAVPGWAAKPDRTRGWQAAPAAAGELRFTTDLPAAPPLRVQLVQSK
jgi:hypothetical protein